MENNNKGTELMCVTVGQSTPNSAIIDDAIIYSVDIGAKVIQLSLEVSQTSAIDVAIQYAINNGVVVICASGNTSNGASNGSVTYPANNANVISVGATDQTDHRATFSNYGSNLTIAAPGVDIESTQISNKYSSSSGTSFAAPQVSAVVASMLVVNPNLSPLNVKSILINTADKVGGYSYSNGRCDQLGYGRLNAYAAVKAALPEISGPSTICSSEAYEVPNLPSGATVTWTTTGAISISGSNTANPVTVTKTTDGTGTLTATVGTACGNLPLPVKNITAGILGSPAPTGPTYITDYGDSFGYDIPKYPDAISYEWICERPIYVYSYTEDSYDEQDYWCDIIFPEGGYYEIKVKITTPCGEVITDGLWVAVDYSQSRSFSYFPNPAKDQLTVSYEEPKKQSIKNEALANIKAQTPVFEIKLMDDKGLVLKSARSNGNKNSVDISTKDIPDGTYYLYIINKGKTIKKQVVVQH